MWKIFLKVLETDLSWWEAGQLLKEEAPGEGGPVMRPCKPAEPSCHHPHHLVMQPARFSGGWPPGMDCTSQSICHLSGLL